MFKQLFYNNRPVTSSFLSPQLNPATTKTLPNLNYLFTSLFRVDYVKCSAAERTLPENRLN